MKYRLLFLFSFILLSASISAQSWERMDLELFKPISGESEIDKKKIVFGPEAEIQADLVAQEISELKIKANCENCTEDKTDELTLHILYDDGTEERVSKPLAGGKKNRDYNYNLQWWKGRKVLQISLSAKLDAEKQVVLKNIKLKTHDNALSLADNQLNGAYIKDSTIIQNDLIIVEGQTSDPPVVVGLPGKKIEMIVSSTGSNEKDLLAERSLMIIVFDETATLNRTFEKKFDGHVQSVTFDLNNVDFLDENSFFVFLPVGLDYLACIRQIVIHK